jgi:hypothetical protein
VNKWLAAACAVAVLLGARHLATRPIRRAPGVLVAEEPRQVAAVSAPWDRQGYRISPLATFAMRGRVLHTERYRFDRAADLAPVDLALGWGPMSDQSVIDQLSIDQGARWYHWTYSHEPPIPPPEIVTHSANVHAIPADPRIAERLKSVRAGSVIELRGYLVQVDGSDGWHWVSSLSRDDTGDGSCEVLWVEQLSIVG